MRPGKRISKSVFLGALLLLPIGATAQDKAASDEPLAACRSDFERLCPDEAEGMRGLRCLRRREADLSEGCRAAIRGRRGEMRSAVKELGSACEPEIERWCKNARGPMYIVHCLRKHQGELSDACRDALPERHPGAGRRGAPPPGRGPHPGAGPPAPDTGDESDAPAD